MFQFGQQVRVIQIAPDRPLISRTRYLEKFVGQGGKVSRIYVSDDGDPTLYEVLLSDGTEEQFRPDELEAIL